MDDKLRDNFSPPSSLSTTDTSINDSLNVDMLDDHIDNHRAHRLSIESTNSKSNKQFLKYISLVTLTIQNASLTLFMRAAKTQKESFISSTAVIMAELLKLLTCIFMVYRDEGDYYC